MEAKQEVHHINENALTVQIKESNVGKETALSLLNEFTPFFEQAEEWKKKAKDIVITDASQVTEMQQARDARLALKTIRVDVDHKRKLMGDESRRKVNAINGIANVIKYLIVPIEEHLQEQEDFVKRQEEKRLAEIRDKREAELAQYDVDTEHYNLQDMTEEGYQHLKETNRILFENRKAAEKQAEEERIAKEKAEDEERERIHKENEQLKKEAKAGEKQKAIEREKLRKEQEARKKVEGELKAQKDEGERLKQEEQDRIETERKAREKADKDARLAPDKEKLTQLAVKIAGIEMPDVTSAEARTIIKDVTDTLNKMSAYIKDKCLIL